MRPPVFIFFAILGCIFLGFSFCDGLAAKKLSGLKEATPVTLTADQLEFDEETGAYSALGNVRLKKNEFTLLSEKMHWNPESEDVSASGKVLVLEPNGSFLAGERFDWNMASGKGALFGGKGFWKETNFYFKAEKIEQLDENSYRARDAEFTSCAAEVPAWKFKAKELKVTRGGYAQAKHSIFYLRDIPVLYLPYYAYPVENRKTGLLMPSYGNSNKRGVQISQPFYWAISRNTDATFYIDYLSKLGLGKGLEYRYIWSEHNAGEFRAYHINGWDEGEDRFSLSWDHSGVLPGDVKLMADVEYVDKKDFFEDFGQDAEEYNQSTAISTIYVQRNWEKLNLTGQLKSIKDLETSNDETLQRLPDVRLSLIRKRFKETPLFYGFDTSANYFHREEGNKGGRVTLRPYVASVLKPVRFLDIDAEFGFLGRLYQTSDVDEAEGLFDFNIGASTRIHRVFTLQGKTVKKIKHSFEPEIRYSYIPPENQEDLPRFDRLDDIEPENKLSLSLINRLTARLETSEGFPRYHEFFYFRLAQEFDIRESRRDRDSEDLPTRPFSPIRAELIIRPTTWSFVDLDATYDVNPESDSLAIFRASAGVKDQTGNGLSFGYTYLENEAEYFTGSVSAKVLEPLTLSYLYRYDFTDNRSLESVVGMEYCFQCWSVNLMYRDRLDDQEIMVAFVLKGIGNVFDLGFDRGG